MRCVSLVVTGDVLLHEPLWAQAERDGGAAGLDFGPLLSGQAPYLAESDVAVCHLETPLSAAGSDPKGYPNFSVPAQIATALAAVGYDGCSTASNHTVDQGVGGVDATLDALDAAGLRHAGSYRTPEDAATPTIFESPGGAVALIAATYGLNTGSPPDPPWQVEIIDVPTILEQADVARAAGADLVVVALHAGTEYRQEPTDVQRATARALLESPDIDFVYGHHAHVVQPLESVGGKWVAYGLGNAVAAHGIVDLGNREGLLVRVRFGQLADGTWRTTDIGWVPSLVDDAVPYRWCALQPGSSCSDDDATSRDRIASVVNAEGAVDAGAHLWTP
ncbi:MAG: CapA family protein [Nakamurella sp.]